jgi:putative nucleotidyltransferase with HDIG domain
LAEAAEQILALVGSLRAHDRHTRGHSERVRVYSDLIAAELRLPPSAVDRLRWAALLHDIGKIRVPAKTLNKPAKLSNREWETIRQHPVAGAELASALLPWLGEWGRAIAEHHERFDGTGYPFGLSGRDISLAGRIVAVADSFEVMTASRVYKRAMTRSTALEEVVRFSGSQFDPEVVRAFLAVSAPKLRWAMGPTSWLVGTPLLGSAPSLTAAGVAAQASVGVTAVAVASVTGVAGPAIAASGHDSPAPLRVSTGTSVAAQPSAKTGQPGVRNPTPATSLIARIPGAGSSSSDASNLARGAPAQTSTDAATIPAAASSPTATATPSSPLDPQPTLTPDPTLTPAPSATPAKLSPSPPPPPKAPPSPSPSATSKPGKSKKGPPPPPPTKSTAPTKKKDGGKK